MKRYAPWAGSMDENEAGRWVKREEVRELEAENERLRETLKKVQGLGYNKDCLFCGFKDKTVKEALEGGSG